MPQQYFDYPYLKTIAGAVVATVLITEFIKDISLFKKIPTRLLVFFIALFVVISPIVVMGEFLVRNLFLYGLDALLVSFSSTGSWDALFGRRK